MNLDPLEVISNLQNIVPVYDPFFSAEDHEVVGYEIIGKYVKDHVAVDVDPFFLDDQVPEEYRLEAYQHLLKTSIESFNLEKQKGFLAIRMNPQILLYDVESLLQTILGDPEFHPSQLILILPEESLKGLERSIEHCVHYVKTFGIRISIENIESSGVRLERIAPLSPNFIRITLSSYTHQSHFNGLDETLYALSSFARKTGATLMFDQIQMDYQLRVAWKNGGRYFQGSYFSSPSPIFYKGEQEIRKLKEELSKFILLEKKKLAALYTLEQTLNQDLQGTIEKHKNRKEFDAIITEAAQILQNRAFRIYVCDESGYQLSSNLLRTDQKWIKQTEYSQKNWSWRPYFLENVFKMSVLRQGLLSDLYSDIESGELIRTFSIPITNQYFMFIDLSYSFLYEEENLL